MRALLVVLPVALLAVAPAVLGAKKEPPPPPLPAPEVQMRVEARSGKPWRIEITNNAAVPLRITADIRLLRLMIDPPAAAAPSVPLKKGQKPPKPPMSVECVLPSVMRAEGRTLLIPPGGKWSEELDPRLHCLDRVDKLLEGATVTARLGFAPPKGGELSPPFAVVPSASAPQLSSAKEIAAPPFTLGAAAFPAPSASAKGPIVATGGSSRSFAVGKDVEVSVTIKNVSSASQTLYARPQLIDARVQNPAGQTVACSGPPFQPAPIIDFVTKLAPNATWSSTVPLGPLCPPGTFEQSGLYSITPIVHLPPMPQVQGEVTGGIVADKPQLVRVESGGKPFYDAPPKLAK